MLGAVVAADWTAVRANKKEPTWGSDVTCEGTSAARNCYLRHSLEADNSVAMTHRIIGGDVSATGGYGPRIGVEINGGTVFNGWVLANGTSSNYTWYRVTEDGSNAPVYVILSPAKYIGPRMSELIKITVAANANPAVARAVSLYTTADGENMILVDTITVAAGGIAFGTLNGGQATMCGHV